MKWRGEMGRERSLWVLQKEATLADRRNIWASLYDAAQDPDPMTALAAIKRINNIVGRWQNAAVRSATSLGRERGEPLPYTLRQIADVLGDLGWERKARGVEDTIERFSGDPQI